MNAATSPWIVCEHLAENVPPGLFIGVLGGWELIRAVNIVGKDVVFTLGWKHIFTVPIGQTVRVRSA